MNQKLIIGIVAIIIVAAGIGIYSSNSSKTEIMEKEVMMQKEEGAMMQKDVGTMVKDDTAMMTKYGSYEMYSPEKIALAAAKGDVVLDFYAGWCPVCRSIRADILANMKDIPANLTILEVDYDTATLLKKKYGVTLQSTMVQVDKDGTLIKKWNMMNSTPTLAEFLSALKK